MRAPIREGRTAAARTRACRRGGGRTQARRSSTFPAGGGEKASQQSEGGARERTTHGNDVGQAECRAERDERGQEAAILEVDSLDAEGGPAALAQADDLAVVDDDLERRTNALRLGERRKPRLLAVLEQYLADVGELDPLNKLRLLAVLSLARVEPVEPVVLLLPRRVVILAQARLRRPVPARVSSSPGEAGGNDSASWATPSIQTCCGVAPSESG